MNQKLSQIPLFDRATALFVNISRVGPDNFSANSKSLCSRENLGIILRFLGNYINNAYNKNHGRNTIEIAEIIDFQKLN